MVAEEVELEISFQAELLIHFGYVKTCFEEKQSVDKNFPYVLRKVVENLPIDEYNILLNVPGHTKYYGEKRIESCVLVIVKFVKFVLDKNVVVGQIRDFFDKILAGKGLNEVIDHHMQLIIIDQVVAPQGGASVETNEQMVLQKKARKLLSPIVSLLPGVGEYGIFHVGLCIGEKLFCEWTTSSIILFTKVYTQIPVITMDLEPLKLSKKNKNDIIEDIANVIYSYNSTKSYNLVSCNCQHFCSDLLKGLKIKPIETKGAHKKFINKMLKKGESETDLDLSNKFKKTFNLESKEFKEFDIKDDVLTFNTHRELDLFSSIILKKYKGKEPIAKALPEWNLLKAFDDIMWIKYFNVAKKMENLKKYKCLEEDCKIKCPFKENIEEESEIFKRIVKRNEEFNSIWYEHYMEDLSFDQWKTEDSGMEINEKANEYAEILESVTPTKKEEIEELKKNKPVVQIFEL